MILNLSHIFEQCHQQLLQQDEQRVSQTKVYVVHNEDYEVTWLHCHPSKVVTMLMGFVFHLFSVSF